MTPPPAWEGPWWLFSRLPSSVGALVRTRSAALGAVPGRFVQGLVRCPACGHVLFICGDGVFSHRPQGGWIALEVRLAGHCEGFPQGPLCRLCMVASWLRVAARGSRRLLCVETLLQDAMKGSKESSSGLCLPGDGPRSVACLGVSGVVAWVSGSAWA